MSKDKLLNIMRREAANDASGRTTTRVGIVTAYDPDNYAAKVMIQPDNYESGWLPVTTPWSGNGWGMFCPPSPGDVVDLGFQEGDRESSFIRLRFYSSVTRPLPCPSGEFWLVHKTGGFVKLLNTGDIEVNATGDIKINAAGKVIGEAQEWDLTGNVNVTGDLLVTGEIRDHDGEHGTVGHIRDVYDIHTHSGVETGDGDTAEPNQQLPDA